MARLHTRSACVEFEAARTPITTFSVRRGLQAFCEALDLDVVGLVAVLRELGGSEGT